MSDEQRRRIDEVSRAEGVTLAEIVRRALDAYLDREDVDPRGVLAATFGADPVADYPDRNDWNRG